MDMSWKAAHLPPAHISTNKSTLVSRPLRCCKRRSRRVAGATGRAAYEALDLHPVNPSAPALTPPTKPTAQPGTPRPAVQPNAAASGLDVLPVMTITTETLASQTSIAEAVAALAAHLPAVLAKYSPLASGVVRLEVPVARGATALQWLAGQELAPAAHEGGCLAPRIYFSGRHSAAPDTPRASRAEGATRGWTAVAGVGAAWRWQGDGGEAFDGAAVKQMQRFLSPDQPRVRILGGTRFNSGQTPSPEWQTFGAYLFVLPLLEYLEVEGGGVLAATLAWDSAVSEPMAPPSPEPAQPFFSASTSSSPPHHNQHAQQAGSSGSAVGMNAPSLSNTDDQNGVSSSSNMDRNDITSSASSSTERNGSSHSRSTASHAGKHKGGGNTNPSDRSSSPSSSSSFLRDAQETSSRSSRPCTPAGHLSARGTGAPSLGLAVAAAAEALQSLQPAAPRTAPAHHVQVAAEQQTPTEAAWHTHLAKLLQALGRDVEVEQRAAAAAANAAAAESGSMQGAVGGLGPRGGAGGAPLTGVDLQLARQEYLTYGQEGLDDLLAAFEDSIGKRGSSSSALQNGSSSNNDADSDEAACPPRDPDEGSAQGLSKVVMARRSSVALQGPVCGLWLLEALQERDPRAYQLYLSDGCGTSFVGSTPERLYTRTGRHVASEAVAGTRPRGPPGDVERDFWLSLDLLKSPKDHAEFVVVRDWIRDALAPCVREVDVEVPKSVLKQGPMQHLYGRLAAELRPGMNDAHLLAALHPTPAVCGRPREDAQAWLAQHEEFDRGFYAGPFGWVSGAGAEFAVAIRSALVQRHSPQIHHDFTVANMLQQPLTDSGEDGAAILGDDGRSAASSGSSGSAEHTVHLYAGVGVVAASDPAAEWQELDLKTRPFWALLRHMQPPLKQSANINLTWCGLLVEELCRQGASMFCIAPGSRSSPLAMAAALHPRARLNVCLDERSLGFWALGYGRAARTPAVVITSSGTAVANLLPAVVEASLSGVPLLLVTADRPGELRDTGANQTIDQVKIFGAYTRWFHDVQPPHDTLPGRAILTTAATAMRHSLGGSTCGGTGMWGGGRQGDVPGPVHLNLQLREPLAPVQQPWSRETFLAGLARWSAPPYEPFTRTVAVPTHTFFAPPSPLEQSAAPALTPQSAALAMTPQANPTLSAGVGGAGSHDQAPPVAAAGGVLLPPGWADTPADMEQWHSDNQAQSNGYVGDMHNGLPSDDGATWLQGSSTSSISNSNSYSSAMQAGPHTLAPSSLPLAPAAGSEISGLLMLLARAQRGLVVVGEQADPGDVVAAAQVASILGWPVAADVLSGLRLGGCSSNRSSSSSSSSSGRVTIGGSRSRGGDGRLAVIHHMDHLLLDQSCWEVLKPDVILQLGPRITSKRMGQFMEWCAGGSSSSNGGSSYWVYVDSNSSRHDPGHLVSHRAVLPLPTLAHALAAYMPVHHHQQQQQQQQQQQRRGKVMSSRGLGLEGDRAVTRGAGNNGRKSSGSQALLGGSTQRGYFELLMELDSVVGHEVDAALQDLRDVSEPLVARILSRDLPPGHGLFLGNSMPIRDMDMYAASPSGAGSTSGSSSSSSSNRGSRSTWVRYSHAAPAPLSLGVPVAANRGASGIDGVLSTAAGFAEGLARPCTLVVGDLSFLHDINGLSLLRAGEARPPLTVVLVNNGGGGIFSFLPIANALPEQQFTQLWATPQNVDLEGMCRAHGIPHQRASTPEEYQQALNSAWGLNRHSVVEVVTGRSANVDVHRMLQQRARRAMHAYLALRRLQQQQQQQQRWQQQQQQQQDHYYHEQQDLVHQMRGRHRHQPQQLQTLGGDACITGVTWSHFALPLALPLTSTTSSTNPSSAGAGVSSSDDLTNSRRHGLLLRVRLRWGGRVCEGVGEVAPLPGLHPESLAMAEAALAVVASMMEGVHVPAAVCLLGGRLGQWLRSGIGLQLEQIPSSVRFGLESALLSALASAYGTSLPDLLKLSSSSGSSSSSSSGGSSSSNVKSHAVPDNGRTAGQQQQQQQHEEGVVRVNGLLSPRGDPAEAVAAAQALVAAGHTCIKVKVARRPSSPEDDAQTLAAIRASLGPGVTLRADANRGWMLAEAVRFAHTFRAGCGNAGCGLEYVEEPVQHCAELPQFYALTGMPYAVDESLDDGSWSLPPLPTPSPAAAGGSSSSSSSTTGAHGPPLDGLAAIVVKPARLGGIEAALGLAAAASRHGIRAVISSCFESPVGISTLAVVAAAADALSPASDPTDSTTPTTTSSSSTTPHSPTFHSSQPYSNTQPISGTSSGAGASSGIPALGMAKGKGASTQHGLGTLQWFQPEPLFAFLCSLGAADSSVGSGSVGRGSSSGSSSSSSILLADAVHVLQQAASASPQRTANRTRLQTPSMSAAAGGPASSAPLSPPSFEELAWEQTVHTSSCSSSSSSSSTRHNSHSHPGCVITLRGILVRPRHPLPLHQTSPSPNTVTTTTHPHTTTTATHQTASIYPHPAAATGSAAAADAAASSPHSLSPSHSTCPLPSSGLVVLLHGFLGSSQDWRAHMQGLAAHGHTCLAIDLPGHGSTTITPTTVADPSTNSTIATTNAPTATDPRTTTTTSNASTNTTSDSSTTTTTSSNDAPTTAADPSTAAANSTTIITNAPTIALDPSTTSAGRHSPAAADPSIAPAAYATSRSNTSITNPSNIPSIEDCASLVGGALRQAGVERCGLLVGYSLGARLALCLAVQQPRLVGRLALVSGTPGIKDPVQAAWRARADDRLARLLRTQGTRAFLHHWYADLLWRSLRQHPQFPALMARRAAAQPQQRQQPPEQQMQQQQLREHFRVHPSHRQEKQEQETFHQQSQMQQGSYPYHQQSAAATAESMADALSALSTGRMRHMWPDLPHLPMPVDLIAGAQDAKFVTINSHMHRVIQQHRQRQQHRRQQQQVEVLGPQQQQQQQHQQHQQQQTEEPGQQQQRLGGQMVGLHIVDGAGHAVHIEQPLLLLQLLTSLAETQPHDN